MSITNATHFTGSLPARDAATTAGRSPSIAGAITRRLSYLAARYRQALLERRTLTMLDDLGEHLQRDIGYMPRGGYGSLFRP